MQPSEIRQLYRDPLAPFRQRRFTPTYSPVAEEAAATTSVGWTRSLTPSPVRPSYKSGFARSAAESASPGLHDGMVVAYVPALGITGDTWQNVLSTTFPAAPTQTRNEGVNKFGIHSGETGSGTNTISDCRTTLQGEATVMFVGQIGTSSVGTQRIFSIDSGAGFGDWAFIRNTSYNNGLLGVNWGWAGFVVTYAVSDNATGVWVARRTGTAGSWTAEIWEDGLMAAQTTGETSNPTGGGTPSCAIATRDACKQLNALMAWNRALSDNEIRHLSKDIVAPFRQRRFTPTYSPVEEEEAAATTSVGWTRSLTPSPVRPSYKSGFARSAAESSSPGLWKGMYSGGMGSQLYDIAARQPVSFYSNTADRIVGEYGEAWHFNDTRNAEAITLNHLGNTWLDGATEFTYGLAFRYHGTNSGDEDTLMGQYSSIQGSVDNEAKRAMIRYDSNNNQMDWFLDDGSDEGMITAVSIEDDGWHVVLHRFKSGEQTGWIDGALVATDSTPDTTIQSAVHSKVPEVAGGHAATHSSTDSARIDVAAWWIWDRAITPTEIRQVSNDPLAPFRQRRFTPTISGAAEEAAEWQPYWAPRMTQRIIGSGVR